MTCFWNIAVHLNPKFWLTKKKKKAKKNAYNNILKTKPGSSDPIIRGNRGNSDLTMEDSDILSGTNEVTSLVLPARRDLLNLPSSPKMTHPLHTKLRLLVCAGRGFQSTLQTNKQMMK